MAFKLVTLFSLLAIVTAGPLDNYHQQAYQQQAYQQQAYQPQAHQHNYQSAPVVVKKVIATPSYAKHEEYESGPVEYDFNYAVNDEHTGDVKSQQESRKGDHVVGQYTLIDADGYRRIVDYTSDEHEGFQATVRREPVEGYKQPIAQKYAQAPAAQKYVETPIDAYKHAEAPIVQKYIQSPVAQTYNQGPAALNYVQAPKYQAPKYSAPITKIVNKAPVSKYIAPVAKYIAPVQTSQYIQPSAKYVHQSAPAASQAQYDAYHKAQYEEAAPVHDYHY